MDQQGLAIWLLVLLAVRALGHTALAYQSATKQVTAADAARTFAVEWRMEATAHVASLMVRDQQCKGDPGNCDLQDGASDAIETLSKWAVGDKGWERMLSSVSLYAIARHAYQEAEYDEAIIALEESLALRLFAYADQKTLDRWQQGLVMPGSLFRRQKMDLANTLVLRSDCLVQLAREQRDVDDLTEAMELLQLATALLKGGDELVPDSVQAISRRAAAIASAAAELLPQLKTSRVKEVLEHHGIACTSCSSKGDYLMRLVPLLRLPVRVIWPPSSTSSSKPGGSSSSSSGLPLIEPLPDPFNSHATALLKKPLEHVAQYMQRMFFRLLTLVPADYLAELDVACRRTDAKGRCISYLPLWVTAQAITIDKRTGMAHVSGPGACTEDGTGAGTSASSAVSEDPKQFGACGSTAATQLRSEPFFVPGDGAGLPDAEPHNKAGIELCGFLHIRAIPPGVTLPTTGGSLTPQQQKILKDKAAEGAATGPAMNSPFKGVYYYYYADIPGLVDRIINTFDPEEADFLFEQLDNLTAARSLHLAGRMNTLQAKGCNEQALLEGKALPTCSVLVPNLGNCAKAPLKPPRQRIPLDPIPTNIALPPPVGTYAPRFRQRVPADTAWSSSVGDGSNASGDRDELSSSSGDSDSSSSARSGRHHHRGAHAHFPLTDRELSDRQLQEQMAKLARDAGRRDRDDPLVPLTLAGCAVASFGLYLASKRRRRFGSSSTSSSSGTSSAARLVLLGLGTSRLKQSSSSGGNNPSVSAGLGSSSSGAGLAGSGGSGVSLVSGSSLTSGAAGTGAGIAIDGAVDSVEDSWDGGGSKHKRLVAAALRVAMNNTDTAKLEAALADAEAVDLGEAALLQRARTLLEKRKKKDQLKAAAEKAKLRAQKREEAKKGRKAAASTKRDVAEVADTVSPCSRADDAAAAAAGEQQQQQLNSSRSSDAGGISCAEDAVGRSSSSSKSAGTAAVGPPGRLRRLLQLFGLNVGGSSCQPAACTYAANGSAATADVKAAVSLSRASSRSLSRASSFAAGAAAASSNGSEQQQQLTAATERAVEAARSTNTPQAKAGASSHTSRSSSMSDVSAASKASAAAHAAACRTVSSHPITTEFSGSSVEDMCNLSDTAASPTSPEVQSSSTASVSTPAPASASSNKSNSGSYSKRKGKGASNNSHHQHTAFSRSSSKSGKLSAFDSPQNSTKSPLDIAAEIAAAAEARAAELAQKALAKAAKQKKQEAMPSPLVVANGPTSVVDKQLQQEQQQRRSAAVSAGVTAPVTPPAVAAPAAGSGTAARAAGAGPVQYGSSASMQLNSQQQGAAAVATGAAPAAWSNRQAAVSDDGSSSTCSAVSKVSSAATSTPSKPRLNPKAPPYQPSPALTQAAKAAIAAAAAQHHQQQQGHASMFGNSSSSVYNGSPNTDWRGVAAAATAGSTLPPYGNTAVGGALPMRGVSPVAGTGGLLGDASAVGTAGLMLGSSSSMYQLQQHLGPADATMDINTAAALHYHHHGGGGLVRYSSADHGLGLASAGFDQCLTSPNQHRGNMSLMASAAALSPQQQFNMQQHMHQQQQLMELLSAAGPGEARYGGIASAGGSAPVNLGGHGNSVDAYLAANAAAAARAQRSSHSSVPDHHAAMQGAGAAGFPASTGGGRGVPPGFDCMCAGQQQQPQPQLGHQQHRNSKSAGLTLNIDDDQLPPGFSAEDYTTTTPSSSTIVTVPGVSQEPFVPLAPMSMASAGTPTTLPSPGSIPTTAPLGVFGSVWAPLAATAGTAASSAAANMRSLWPSPFTSVSAAEHVHPHGAFAQHSYSRSQDLEVEVAAATTSANVAELVLGSSPSMHVAGAADAQMSKLAKEIAMGLLE